MWDLFYTQAAQIILQAEQKLNKWVSTPFSARGNAGAEHVKVFTKHGDTVWGHRQEKCKGWLPSSHCKGLAGRLPPWPLGCLLGHPSPCKADPDCLPTERQKGALGRRFRKSDHPICILYIAWRSLGKAAVSCDILRYPLEPSKVRFLFQAQAKQIIAYISELQKWLRFPCPLDGTSPFQMNSGLQFEVEYIGPYSITLHFVLLMFWGSPFCSYDRRSFSLQAVPTHTITPMPSDKKVVSMTYKIVTLSSLWS